MASRGSTEGGGQAPVDPTDWELDLDLPSGSGSGRDPRELFEGADDNGSEPPRAAAGLAADPGDDPFGDDLSHDLASEIGGLGDMDDLDLPARRPQAAPTVGRRRQGSAPPESSRQIHMRSHARAPLKGLGYFVASSGFAVGLALGVPFLYPEGVARIERSLGSLAAVPLGAAGAVLFVAWVLAMAKALRQKSIGLFVVCGGLVVCLICVGLTLGSVISGSMTSMAFRQIMPLAAPLSAATVVAGLAAFGMRHAKEQLFEDQRRVYGVVLGVVSLLGLVAAVRIARVDLPLHRLGEPYQMAIWGPLGK